MKLNSHPPEVTAEVDRLAKICREDQHVIVTTENGHTKVYLEDAAPLVPNPQTWKEEVTFLKHLVRSGKVDMKRLYEERKDQRLSNDEFLDYCDFT